MDPIKHNLQVFIRCPLEEIEVVDKVLRPCSKDFLSNERKREILEVVQDILGKFPDIDTDLLPSLYEKIDEFGRYKNPLDHLLRERTDEEWDSEDIDSIEQILVTIDKDSEFLPQSIIENLASLIPLFIRYYSEKSISGYLVRMQTIFSKSIKGEDCREQKRQFLRNFLNYLGMGVGPDTPLKDLENCFDFIKIVIEAYPDFLAFLRKMTEEEKAQFLLNSATYYNYLYALTGVLRNLKLVCTAEFCEETIKALCKIGPSESAYFMSILLSFEEKKECLEKAFYVISQLREADLEDNAINLYQMVFSIIASEKSLLEQPRESIYENIELYCLLNAARTFIHDPITPQQVIFLYSISKRSFHSLKEDSAKINFLVNLLYRLGMNVGPDTPLENLENCFDFINIAIGAYPDFLAFLRKMTEEEKAQFLLNSATYYDHLYALTGVLRNLKLVCTAEFCEETIKALCKIGPSESAYFISILFSFEEKKECLEKAFYVISQLREADLEDNAINLYQMVFSIIASERSLLEQPRESIYENIELYCLLNAAPIFIHDPITPQQVIFLHSISKMSFHSLKEDSAKINFLVNLLPFLGMKVGPDTPLENLEKCFDFINIAIRAYPDFLAFLRKMTEEEKAQFLLNSTNTPQYILGTVCSARPCEETIKALCRIDPSQSQDFQIIYYALAGNREFLEKVCYIINQFSEARSNAKAIDMIKFLIRHERSLLEQPRESIYEILDLYYLFNADIKHESLKNCFDFINIAREAYPGFLAFLRKMTEEEGKQFLLNCTNGLYVDLLKDIRTVQPFEETIKVLCRTDFSGDDESFYIIGRESLEERCRPINKFRDDGYQQVSLACFYGIRLHLMTQFDELYTKYKDNKPVLENVFYIVNLFTRRNRRLSRYDQYLATDIRTVYRMCADIPKLELESTTQNTIKNICELHYGHWVSLRPFTSAWKVRERLYDDLIELLKQRPGIIEYYIDELENIPKGLEHAVIEEFDKKLADDQRENGADYILLRQKIQLCVLRCIVMKDNEMQGVLKGFLGLLGEFINDRGELIALADKDTVILYELYKTSLDLKDSERTAFFNFLQENGQEIPLSQLAILNRSLKSIPRGNIPSFLNICSSFKWILDLPGYYHYSETLSTLVPMVDRNLEVLKKLSAIMKDSVAAHNALIFLAALPLIPRERWLIEAENYITFSRDKTIDLRAFIAQYILKPDRSDVKDEYTAHFDTIFSITDIDLAKIYNTLFQAYVFDLLDGDTPLAQRIVMMRIQVEGSGDILNPYNVFGRIIKDQKKDIPVVVPYQEVGSSFARLNLAAIEYIVNEKLKHQITYKQLEEKCGPLITKDKMIELFESIKNREGRTQEQINAYFTDNLPETTFSALEVALMSDQAIDEWMANIGDKTGKASAQIIDLNEILRNILLQSNEIKDGEILSEQEKAYLQFLANFNKCTPGRIKQLAMLRRLVPSSSSKVENPSDYVKDRMYKIYIDLLTSPAFRSSLFKRLTGFDREANPHELIFIDNCIGRRLGVENKPVFDPHTLSIERSLCECPTERMLQEALNMLSITTLAEKWQEDIRENIQVAGGTAQRLGEGITIILGSQFQFYFPELHGRLMTLEESDAEIIPILGIIKLAELANIVSLSELTAEPFEGISRGVDEKGELIEAAVGGAGAG